MEKILWTQVEIMCDQPSSNEMSNSFHDFIHDSIKDELKKIDDILDDIAKKRNSTVFALLYSSLTSIRSEHLHKVYKKFTSIVKNSDKEDIDVVLQTMGGYADAAFQLGYTIQKYIEDLESKRDKKKIRLNVIVPRSAKSAGTLLVLCSNCIILTKLSELGPIDPQIRIESRYVSTKTIRDSLRQVLEIVSELEVSANTKEVKKNLERIEAVKHILSRIPVAEMGHYESLLNHVAHLAQELLRNRMMKEKSSEEIRKVAEQLVRGYEYHGFPITYWHLDAMGISCEVVDCELEKLLLELYDIIVKLDTKFLYMYTLLKFGQAFLEAPEEMISMFFQEVVELRNGIIVLPIPSSYIEKFIEEIPS
ncbi:MAG: hypothetical protein QXQ31_02940 [Zestosphaera sp.]